MKNVMVYFGLLALLYTSACKDAKASPNEITLNKTNINSTEAKTTAETTLYVLAPNGLSLRAENNLNSKILTAMPLGSRVTLLKAATEFSLNVEHIQGGMHNVSFNGQTGYAFSGFLGGFEPPQPEKDLKEYITKLKEIYPGLMYESKDNGPDFHEGYTETFTLPAKTWHEAFFVTAAACYVPKSLSFPAASGPNEEIIEDPEKPTDTWSSNLIITRQQNALHEISYYHRSEGFGSTVTIIRDNENVFRVSYMRFVD